jgi:hypothetical protein
VSSNFSAVHGYFAAAADFIVESEFALAPELFVVVTVLADADPLAGFCVAPPAFVADARAAPNCATTSPVLEDAFPFCVEDFEAFEDFAALDFDALIAVGNSIVMGEGRDCPPGSPAMSCGIACVNAVAA